MGYGAKPYLYFFRVIWLKTGNNSYVNIWANCEISINRVDIEFSTEIRMEKRHISRLYTELSTLSTDLSRNYMHICAKTRSYPQGDVIRRMTAFVLNGVFREKKSVDVL